jgi:hypothetical protein
MRLRRAWLFIHGHRSMLMVHPVPHGRMRVQPAELLIPVVPAAVVFCHQYHCVFRSPHDQANRGARDGLFSGARNRSHRFVKVGSERHR